MALVTLSSLIVPALQSDILTSELTIAASVGLPTTSWQPLAPERAILYTNAQIVAQYSQTAAFMAQGGYASLAATMVDANGNPITTWMDLIAFNNYNLTRIPATAATLPAAPGNSSSGFGIINVGPNTFGPFAANQVIFQNPTTRATYTNTGPIAAIPGDSAIHGIAITATGLGSSFTSAPGTITALLTPFAGVTCTNYSTAIGTDAESNAAFLQRCQAKLANLSPNGSAAAYAYIATSLTDTTQVWYNRFGLPSAPITRTAVQTSPGVVNVYLANASGGLSAGDVSIANSAIQALCVPDAITAIVASAAAIVVPITYTVYVPTVTGYTSGTVTSAISSALATYFSTLPIGGITDQTVGVVPYSALIGVIMSSLKGFNSVTLSAPAADVALTANQVATLGAITPTVTFV